MSLLCVPSYQRKSGGLGVQPASQALLCEYEGVVLHRGRALRLRQQPPKEEAAREGPQHEAGKRNRDGRAGVACNFAARGGRRLDARHAPAHAQDETRASIRPDIINKWPSYTAPHNESGRMGLGRLCGIRTPRSLARRLSR